MTLGDALAAGFVFLSILSVALFLLYRREAAAKAPRVNQGKRWTAKDVTPTASGSGTHSADEPTLTRGIGSPESADRPIASASGIRIIDQDVLNELQESLGPEDFGQVVDVFLADMPPLMDRLAASVARQDALAIFATAHEGKGTAASLGLDRLADVMGRMEVASRTARPEALDLMLEEAQKIWIETAYAVDSTTPD